ncbi:adenine deaminase [Spirochaetia bacterium]|nr:adenine deaminase [Spirochaetia bacterium]
MVITGARVFNVYRRVFEKKALRVQNGIFTDVDEKLTPAGDEEILDAGGLFLVPGLVDIHMHIESSMTVPREFSRAVLPWGTTTVVADPHEIANVFGIEGIRCFLSQASQAPALSKAPASQAEAVSIELDIFFGLPSSVPSTNPQLETTGGIIGPEEIRLLAAEPGVLCLGEVMNAHELAACPPQVGACSEASRTGQIIAAFQAAKPRFPIEGHCPKIQGSELSAFIAAGVWADHTYQTPASILEKIDKGMFIELQKKTITPENIALVKERQLFEHIALVTDDVMPDDLVSGHLNRLVQQAIALGLSPEEAIYCATYTPSRHMGLRDRGAIAPGRIADFILLEDPVSFVIAAVYKRGKKIFRPGEAGAAANHAADGASGTAPGCAQTTVAAFPPHFYTSVKRRPLKTEDLVPPLPPGLKGESISCVTMKIDADSTLTRRGSRTLPVQNGKLLWQGQGLCLVTVLERYGHEAPPSFGLVEGMFSGQGAAAASWAHDHHNILAAGTNEADIVLAVNTLIEEQGGYVVAREGKIVANTRLPVAGILSEAPIEELAAAIRQVRQAMIDLGYVHKNVIMSFSTLSLPVSPELKISDKGLIDTVSQSIVGLYETTRRE